MNYENLKTLFASSDIRVGIIGLGYVGLPLAKEFLSCGITVYGIDSDRSKIDRLVAGDSYIQNCEIELSMIAQKRFVPTTDFSELRGCDAIIICVPTPLSKNREPDLSYINGSLEHLAPHMREHQFLALESTTYPGTTREVLAPFVEKQGFIVGENYFVGYSPEREDPGNSRYQVANIPKVVSGITPKCLDLAQAVYQKIVEDVVVVSSCETAELTKLLENIYRSVNIGLVNEMKTLAHQMDIDIFEVIRAAATKPFGYTPFFPGPGIGGHCIPLDPFYLTWKAREYGVNTRFIELAGEINRDMPRYVLSRLTWGLNQRSKAIKGSKILLCGIAYKKNVGDLRESPAIEVFKLLEELGAKVVFSDPYVDRVNINGVIHDGVDLSVDLARNHDACVILTDHDHVDYDLLLMESMLVVDTRGVYPANNNAPNLVVA